MKRFLLLFLFLQAPISRSAILEDPYTALAQLIEQISIDSLYQDMVKEEKQQFTMSSGREARTTTRLNQLYAEFEDKYGEDFHNLKYAFALLFPEEVYRIYPKFPSFAGRPLVLFKEESPIGDVLEFDTYGLKLQHQDLEGTVDYVPFVDRARAFLKMTAACLDFWTNE